MKLFQLIALGVGLVSVSGQEFVNLGFNEPNLSGSLSPIEPNNPFGLQRGRTADLLRGWTLLGNGQPLNEIIYSPVGAGLMSAATLDARRLTPSSPLEYRLFLFSGPPNLIDYRLMQTGLIPSDASGLALRVFGYVDVFINGNAIYRANVLENAFPVVDVSGFSGQVVSLEFHVLQGSAGTDLVFDIDGFTRVPEPSTYAMCGFGILFLVILVRYQSRNKI